MAEMRTAKIKVQLDLEELYYSLYVKTKNLAELLETQASALRSQSQQYERLWREQQSKNAAVSEGRAGGEAD